MTPNVRAVSRSPLLLALLLGLGVWGASAQALANGRFPGARQIALHPTDPSTLLLRTTFGQMLTSDGGASFHWICEEAIGYGGTQDPAALITSTGALLNAAYEGTSVSLDGGCSFAFPEGLAKRYGLDLALDASLPSRALLTVAADISNKLPSQLWETLDGGKIWVKKSDIPQGFFPQNIDVARPDGQRVYVTGLRDTNGSNQASLLRSIDGGATWEMRDLPLEKAKSAYLSAIDPLDASRIYVRVEGADEDTLLRSDDGGDSYQPLASLEGGMLGFALSPDGSRVAIGGPTGGVLVASRNNGDFVQQSATPITCLTWAPDGLLACGLDESSSGFALGRSLDEGKSFSPILVALGDTCGPLDTCGATSPYAALCPDRWPALKTTLQTSGATCVAGGSAGVAGLGGSTGAASASSAGATVAAGLGGSGSAGGAGGQVASRAPHDLEGGCDVAGGGLGTSGTGLLLGWLVWVGRVGRRKTTLLAGLALAAMACSTPDPQQSTPHQAAGATGEGGAGAAGSAGAAAVMGGASAAGGEASTAGAAGFRPLEVRPLYYRGSGAPYEPIDKGAKLTLQLPPQGGYVLWIAAEVTGVQASEIDIRGRLRSKETGYILAEEYRTVAVKPVAPGSDTVRPEPLTMRNVTNLPVCPNYGEEEFLGIPLVLEVTVDDLSTSPQGRGTSKTTVMLVCAEGATNCPCECSLGYVLGKCGPSLEVPPDF